MMTQQPRRPAGLGHVGTLLMLLLLLPATEAFAVPRVRSLRMQQQQQQQQQQQSGAGGSTVDGTPKRVLVIGGTGRVGGSTVRALRALTPKQASLPPVALSVGGRSRQKFEIGRQRWIDLEMQREGKAASYEDVAFVELDHENPPALTQALAAHRPDLIIHTAGPFQQRRAPEVLKAALQLKIPYVDVCDDIELSTVAKGFHEEAQRAGVPMLISTGVWPGVSSLMAVDVAEALGGPAKTKEINFEFYTAGSGGAGTTILSATFLILSEKVLAFVNGKRAYFPAASDFRKVDFGPNIGPRQVFRMNLLEAFSCNRVLGVPNVATFFGTAPDAWNYLLKFMTYLPTSLLRDRAAMQALAVVSEPVVRLIDRLVGSTNAMRVVGKGYDNQEEAVALYAHEDLETCVGTGIAAFAAQVLASKVPPGVYYPEEAFASPAARDAVFELATQGCFTWIRPQPRPEQVRQPESRGS